MRLLIALAGTAAGLAALLSYKTHGPATAAAAAPVTGTQAGSTSAPAGGTGNAGPASPAAQGNGGSAAGSASPAPRQSAAGSAGPAGSGGSAGPRAVTGAVASTPYGPMQVQVTLKGREITGVRVLQQTDTGALSQQIDANAIPQLNRETLAAQSARIDAVSGASYTSAGYIKSLQSALDQATA